ncbi:PEPxxWA-CTERM sorting domain-containing protein [Qipengyuania spongiae]|uniref:PEPxxWA-CTERM sorting domain-containing protein n=1 Tax=Qipengyuania spongiae TaxID=2909673 RepID=A0ABY5SX10_9SPHN|nr:PEPxxWA-CTERM sorting domain-containing protein [Qipengyuania spongiae]UVI39068.1 PEPxxWA-CTERM sorting domain-containing protein [Qipengyuania spongiae]
MASQPTGQLPHYQRHFATYVVGSLVVVLLLVSFFENDRRGLLFTNLPEAFAANEFDQSGQSYRIAFGTLPSSGIGARRTIPRRPAGVLPASSSSSPAGASGVPGNALAPSAGVTLPTFGSSEQLGVADLPPSFVGNGPIGLPPIGGTAPPIGVPGNPGGENPGGENPGGENPGGENPGGENPGGENPGDPGTPVDPVDPPVPAVPEPASWLLMILGVGVIGQVLRRRADSTENMSGLTPA